METECKVKHIPFFKINCQQDPTSGAWVDRDPHWKYIYPYICSKDMYWTGSEDESFLCCNLCGVRYTCTVLQKDPQHEHITLAELRLVP